MFVRLTNFSTEKKVENSTKKRESIPIDNSEKNDSKKLKKETPATSTTKKTKKTNTKNTTVKSSSTNTKTKTPTKTKTIATSETVTKKTTPNKKTPKTPKTTQNNVREFSVLVITPESHIYHDKDGKKGNYFFNVPSSVLSDEEAKMWNYAAMDIYVKQEKGQDDNSEDGSLSAKTKLIFGWKLGLKGTGWLHKYVTFEEKSN